MKPFKCSNENLIAFAIFLLALGYRLAGLGRVPLSDHEAGLALQALSIAQGEGGSFLSQPGYISLTSLLFFLFGAGDFIARLVPAFSGALMVFVPPLFRRYLGSPASLLMALFLAIDPGLLAFSRTADGTALAMTFSLLAAGLWLNGRGALAGVSAGLALLGGPLIWPGLITGGLAVIISRPAFSAAGGHSEAPEGPAGQPGKFASAGGRFWLALAVTAAAAATQFFLHPRGLNAVANSLVEYIRSWGAGVEAPTMQSFLLFFVYEPYFLLAAVYGGFKAWFTGNECDKFLIRWMMLAVSLSIFNPGQTFSTSAWVLIPMLGLAAGQAAALVRERETFTPQAGAQAFITVALGVFFILTLVNLSNGSNTPEDMRLQLAAAAGAAVVLAITTYLLGSGWGWRSSVTGLKTAVLGLLALSILSAGWHAAGLGTLPEREMWRNGRTVVSSDLLISTLGDISEFNTGRRDKLDVTVAGLDLPSLQWAMRDFVQVSAAREVPGGDQASIILTSADELPPLGEQYRGQKITWDSRPAWQLMNPGEWPAWLFFRQAPPDTSSIMIWVRSDLFPGAAPAAAPTG